MDEKKLCEKLSYLKRKQKGPLNWNDLIETKKMTFSKNRFKFEKDRKKDDHSVRLGQINEYNKLDGIGCMFHCNSGKLFEG